MRVFPVITLSVAFLLGVVSLGLVPWDLVPAWGAVAVCFSVLTGFSGVLVAYYVYADWIYAEEGERYQAKVRDSFERRINRLEGAVGYEALERAEGQAQPPLQIKPPPPKNPYYSDSARALLGLEEETKKKKAP